MIFCNPAVQQQKTNEENKMHAKIRLTNKIALTAIVLVALFIQGCGTGKTIIIKPITSSVNRTAVLDIAESNSTVSVPPDVTNDFKTKLDELLYQNDGFNKGTSGTTLKYKFVSYDPGNQFLRWVCGMCGGNGKLVVETNFINGGLISTIQSEGTVESGFFGGTFSTAIDYTASEIATYASKNFK